MSINFPDLNQCIWWISNFQPIPICLIPTWWFSNLYPLWRTNSLISDQVYVCSTSDHFDVFTFKLRSIVTCVFKVQIISNSLIFIPQNLGLFPKLYFLFPKFWIIPTSLFSHSRQFLHVCSPNCSPILTSLFSKFDRFRLISRANSMVNSTDPPYDRFSIWFNL